jgi:hypothetical protein
MMDRTTKVLLAAVAFGLWANVAVTLLKPVAVNAQGMPDLSLSMIQAELSRIGTDLGKIQKGTCLNERICH